MGDQIQYNWLFMRPRNLCVLAKNGNLWILLIYARLHMGCGYPTVDINYVNYACAISVLFALLYKYHAHINNR